MNKFTLDIIIITSKRKPQLEKCLSKALSWERAGVVVVAYKSDRDTIEYLEGCRAGADKIKTIIVDDNTPKSEKRNAGIRGAKADIIYFLDDDSFPEIGNYEVLKRKYEQYPGIDIVGGPNITPENSSLFQRIAGYVLSSSFTAWKMKRRFSVWRTESECDDMSLVLCNLAFKRRIFEQDGISFDERLYYNEENLLLQQFMKKGRKMLYCPELVVYHERRNDIFSFSRQVFNSGRGRGIMTVLMPGSFKLIYALPAIFALVVISMMFAGRGSDRALFYLYSAANIVNSAMITTKNGESIVSVFAVFFVSFIAHMSYGVGFIWGIGEKWAFKR